MAQNNLIKILAFDPGIQHLGYSLSHYDPVNDKMVVQAYGVIHGQQLLKKKKEMTELYGRRFVILDAFEVIVADLMREFQPDYVVTEGAFQHLFPDAYAALVLVIHTIKRAAFQIIQKFVYSVSPKESKKAISHDGTADKETVIDAILKHPDIEIKPSAAAKEMLVEHSADTIAGAWAFIRNHLKNIIDPEGPPLDLKDPVVVKKDKKKGL